MRRSRALVAIALAGTFLVPAGGAAAADISLFEGRAQGSVMSFTFHMPEAVFPFTVTGGALESTVLATSVPQAFGTAGVFPVPLASSAGLVVPGRDPVLGTPVPKEVQEAFKSFNFTNTPNYCQAAFPPVKDTDQEAFCGGPAQRDAALGFTSATANGHVKATGNFDDPLSTRTEATSRAEDATIPSLQAIIRGATSRATSGLNGDRIPQSQARSEIQGLRLLGNVVTLGGIVSETTVVNDGTPEGMAASTRFDVASAAIFGVPVRLGPDGFTVVGGGPGVDAKALAQRVNEAAAVGGFSMRLFPAPPVEHDAGRVVAQSGGVEISYIANTPTPVRVVERYGYTVAAVSAVASTVSAGSDLVPVSDGGQPLPSPATADTREPSLPSPTHAAASSASDVVAPPVTAAVNDLLPPGVPPAWEATAAPAGSAARPDPAAPSRSGRAAPTPAAGTTGSWFGQQALLTPALATTLPASPVRSLYLALVAFTLAGPLIFRARRLTRTA